jgi:HlyD family secretion protein
MLVTENRSSMSPDTTHGAIAPSDARQRSARERRRRLSRDLRHVLIAAVIAAASALAVLALRPAPIPVDLARVTRGRLATVIDESGTTRVTDRFVVSAPVSGSVSRLNLEPGDLVKEGDSLVEIAPAESPLLDERTRAEAEARLGAAISVLGQAQAQVSRARVARELAEQELARARKLAGSGSLTPQALEQSEFSARMRAEELSSAEFASRVASEEVRVARVTLGRDRGRTKNGGHVDVLSPISGRVLRVNQKSAAVVPASSPLVEVGDPTNLEVVVDLLTTDAVSVREGTPVLLRGWGGPQTIAGRVRRVEPSAFTRPSALGVDEQRVNVLIAITDPHERWSQLGDGYRVEARIVLWENDSVLKLPQGAVFRRGDGWAVYRIEDGVARLTQVQLGHWGESEVELLSGLPEKAGVAVYPGDRVADGARVEPR